MDCERVSAFRPLRAVLRWFIKDEAVHLHLFNDMLGQFDVLNRKDRELELVGLSQDRLDNYLSGPCLDQNESIFGRLYTERQAGPGTHEGARVWLFDSDPHCPSFRALRCRNSP